MIKICFHEWERIEEPKHSHYDYSGFEVLTTMCRCKICGKKKERKFIGKTDGQLFG